MHEYEFRYLFRKYSYKMQAWLLTAFEMLINKKMAERYETISGRFNIHVRLIA